MAEQLIKKDEKCKDCGETYMKLRCDVDVHEEKIKNTEDKLDKATDKSEKGIEKLNDKFIQQIEKSSDKMELSRSSDKADSNRKSNITIAAFGIILTLFGWYINGVSDETDKIREDYNHEIAVLRTEQTKLIKENALLEGELKEFKASMATEIEDRKRYSIANKEEITQVRRDLSTHEREHK